MRHPFLRTGLLLLLLFGICLVRQVTRPNRALADEETQPVARPTIVWFHCVSSNSMDSLDLALASGLVTHVMVLYMHRNDADWRDAKAQAVIERVKQSPAQLIWCRDLWPYYKNNGLTRDCIYDPDYYRQEIEQLRAEGRAMGADAVALDYEPYGSSVVKPLFKDSEQRKTVDLTRLQAALDQAAAAAGQVDYILPAGSTDSTHPYNLISRLGVNRISESTYYNRADRLAKVTYPYEVFGAYVRPYEYNPDYPSLPFFTVADLFERSDLWSGKKGVFLYTDGRHSLETARTLMEYRRMLLSRADAVAP